MSDPRPDTLFHPLPIDCPGGKVPLQPLHPPPKPNDVVPDQPGPSKFYGTISAVDSKAMTFTVDNTTKFVGKGLGTKAKAGKLTATDAVAMNDHVRVAYHDMGGTMHAATVTVVSKASAAAAPKK